MFVAEAVEVFHETVVGTVLVDQLGDFDVIAAVLGDLDELALAPPLDGVETLGGLAGAEAGGGDGLELRAVPRLPVTRS